MNAAPPQAPKEVRTSRLMRWHRRVLAFCLVIFAFELGLFLLVFPWLKNWDMSWIPVHSPRLATIWMSPYFRGALSGLGLLNIYVAVLEAVRQLRAIFANGS